MNDQQTPLDHDAEGISETEALDHLEMALLGSCLRHPPAIADAAQLVRPADFYRDRHQRVWRAMVALWEAGKPVDLESVANQLLAQDDVADVSYPFLAHVWDAQITGARAEYYASLVRDRSVCRQLAYTGEKIAADASSHKGPAREVLEEAEQRIFSIAQLGAAGTAVAADTLINDAYARYDARCEHDESPFGVPTGFLDLDALTAGFQNSELAIIAARPSVGKTALAVTVAAHLLTSTRVPVFFASLEQSREELIDRFLCSLGRLDSRRLRRGTLNREERDRMVAAGDLIRTRGRQLHVDDAAGQSMLRIVGNARRLKLRHGIGIVFVDYLQLVDPSNPRENREAQVALVSRKLKQMAKELALPVVALAQLNRAPDVGATREPRLSDLRESGSIEADADMVLLLHRPTDPGLENVVDVIIGKQRNGPRGTVRLAFRRECMRFENYLPMPAGERALED